MHERQFQRKIKILYLILVSALLYKIAVPNMLKNPFIEQLLRLPFSAISTYTRYIDIIQIPLIGLIFQILLIGVCFLFQTKKIALKFSSPLFWLLILLTIRIASYLLFAYEALSVYYVIQQLILIAIILLISELSKEIHIVFNDKLIHFFIAWGSLCAISSIIYYFIINGTNVLVFRQFRLAGFLYDAIYVGYIYAIAIMAYLLKIVNKSKRKHVTFNIFMILLIFIAGLMTGSRSFFIFIALSVMYMVFTTNNKKRFLTIVVISLICLAFIYGLSKGIFSIDINEIGDASRANKRYIALQAFLSNPIIGVGTSNYSYYEALEGYKGSNPHNMFMEILSENGLIGIFPYIMYLMSLTMNILKKKLLNEAITAVMLCLIVLTMLVGVMGNMLPMVLLIYLSWSIEKTTCSKLNISKSDVITNNRIKIN